MCLSFDENMLKLTCSWGVWCCENLLFRKTWCPICFVEGSLIKEHHLSDEKELAYCTNIYMIFQQQPLYFLNVNSYGICCQFLFLIGCKHLSLYVLIKWIWTCNLLSVLSYFYNFLPSFLKLSTTIRYRIPKEVISLPYCESDRLTESFWLNWQLMTSAWLPHLKKW